jgi:predicted kinase
MRNIHIMSGLPASGKSTFVEGRCCGDVNACYFSRDIFRDDLRFVLRSENYFPVDSRTETVLLTTRLRNLLEQTEADDIWIDQTTIGQNALGKILGIIGPALREDDTIIVEVINTPYNVCFERNRLRENGCVPADTMFQMGQTFSTSIIDSSAARRIAIQNNIDNTILVNRHSFGDAEMP